MPHRDYLLVTLQVVLTSTNDPSVDWNETKFDVHVADGLHSSSAVAGDMSHVTKRYGWYNNTECFKLTVIS